MWVFYHPPASPEQPEVALLPAARRRGMLAGMAKPLAKLVALITPKRRWAQFSLATMFAVVTTLCIWLAMTSNRAHRQRDAVSFIRELEGAVEYAHEYDADGYVREHGVVLPGPVWLRHLVGDEFFQDVVAVHLSGRSIQDGDLARLVPRLAALGGIREFDCASTAITNDGVRHLRSLPDLRQLWLNDTRIDDDGLAYLLTMRRLRVLMLNQTAVTHVGLEHLRHLASLQVVNLYESRATEGGAKRLQEALPNTKIGTPRGGMNWGEMMPPMDVR
jgi:hypothetical protein